MITSSHNPAEWNGVKYKASYGGSGTPSIMTSIESYLNQPLPDAANKATIEEVNFNPQYITAMARFVDLDAITASGYKFLIDCMYGCGRGVIAAIFARAGDSVCRDSQRAEPAVSGHQSGADSAEHQGDAVGRGGGEVRRGPDYRWRRGPHWRSG